MTNEWVKSKAGCQVRTEFEKKVANGWFDIIKQARFRITAATMYVSIYN